MSLTLNKIAKIILKLDRLVSVKEKNIQQLKDTKENYSKLENTLFVEQEKNKLLKNQL